jgi:hypothetical protein
MEAADDGSDASSVESEANSELCDGCFTSGESSDEELVAGCESAGESEHDGDAVETDGEASDGAAGDDAADGDGGDGDEAEKPTCSICTAVLDLLALVTAEQVLVCDGGCGRELPPSEFRLVCPRGDDFDMCVACAGFRRGAIATRKPSSPHPPSQPMCQPPRAAPATIATAPNGEAAIECGECDEPFGQTSNAPHRARTSAEPLVAVPLPAPGLIAGLQARMRARASQGTRGERAMASFMEWQATRAAETARAAEQRSTSATGSTIACVEETAAEQVEPEGERKERLPHTSQSPGTQYALPAPPAIAFVPASAGRGLREQVAAILAGSSEQRQLWVDLAREILRQATGAASEDGEVSPRALRPQRAVRCSFQSTPPRRLGVDVNTTVALPPASLTRSTRCMCCDEDVGSGEMGHCSALELLATLEADMTEQERLIEQALDSDFDEEPLNRAARKTMYRAFVAARFGHLGAGVRVRIPDCVLAAIRIRFPAPGCNCSVAEIAHCDQHGYTGHRDA